MKQHKCPDCNSSMELRRNPLNGGRFLGCLSFSRTGCKVTFCFTDNKFHGTKEIVARGSKNRSQCSSLQAGLVAKLQLIMKETASKAECKELIDTVGIEAIKELIESSKEFKEPTDDDDLKN